MTSAMFRILRDFRPAILRKPIVDFHKATFNLYASNMSMCGSLLLSGNQLYNGVNNPASSRAASNIKTGILYFSFK